LQLLTLLDKWTECLEHGGQINVVYTDFEKAFDKVPHNQLIYKLKHYNVPSDIVECFKSFFIFYVTDNRE